MNKTKKNERLTRTVAGVTLVHRAEDGAPADDRTVELSFSSEEPYQRFFGNEILCHDADAIDLSRLQEIGVLLFNHNADLPIGKVLDVQLDEQARKCTALVRFDTDVASETIYQKVAAGTLKGVSVGYKVDAWEDVDEGATSMDGRFSGPCSIARRWMPYEISIVSLPADMTVGVGRSYEEPDEEPEKEGETAMDKEKETKAVPQESTQEAPDMSVKAIEAERQRTAEIMGMCRRFGMEPDDYIKDGTSVDATRAAIMEQLAAQQQAQDIRVATDEGDKFRAAATDGLAIRAGIHVKDAAAGAENFRGKSLLRLAEECITREGATSTKGMSDEELVRAAMTGTGAFPGILSNVAHKSMAQAYQTAPTTYQLWTAAGSNTDFKAATRYRLSEADDLVPMTETGEFEHSEVTEGAATAAVATYGRTFSLTRKAIIDDDMGALSRIPALYGLAARRVINKMVYKVLTDNPTIEGAPLFDASKHKNTVKGAINVENLGKAKAAMARMKNLKGVEALNVQPAFLIVPPELEVTAAQLISSAVDPTKANATPNPFANRLSVVSDPELTDTDAWYLAAAPGILPTIEVTYLNGREEPTMESNVAFDTLGIKWRIYMDFGVNLIDYRGLLKSSGK